MGKNLRHKVTCSPIQNHPGFMWGLFDILKHNHWRYIKKRLPHKRPLARRNAPGTKTEESNTTPSPDGISLSNNKVEDETNIDCGQRPKKPTSTEKSKESNSGEKIKKQHHSEEKSKKHNSEEKSRRTHSEIKRSVKALIKALVIEDKSKRKGRHHRSCTYPVQSNTKEKESLIEVESSDKNSSNGDDRNRVFKNTVGISPAIGSLNPLYLMSEESSNSDNEDFRVENIPVDDTDGRKSDFDEKESKKKEKSYDDEAWFDPKLRHTKEYSENEDDSSPRRSKACLDALNLIHMNRNFLLKVLQDPGSPLARHFQSQQAFSSKTMTKAGSFPTHGSNREDHNNGFDSVGDIDKKSTSPSIAAEHRADGIQNLNETMSKLADEDSSGSGYVRKRGKNQVVIKRFKDLRQKIKHVINENKNEKHRITMDAVLDKVPRKYGFSKDLRHDIFAHLKAKNNKAEGVKLKQITRTSSLCGSLDRYLQLYESSFQREAKNNNNSEKSKVELEESALPCKKVPKFLGRILSLPEMKSYAVKIEDFPGEFTTSSRSMEQEQKDGLDNISEISEDHSHSSSEHETFEKTMEASENLSIDAENPTSVIETEQDAELETSSLKDSSEASPDLVSIVDFDENSSGVDISREQETETVSTSKQLDEEVLQVEAQDKVKFNYVRDILEISGFNAPESLSMWQLDYQPLDPLVYEEVITTTTGCMIQDPECSRNEEEGGNCNHLLLFDLINEVLIEIYERSYHYYPKPLSSLCKIHPMPVGYSVLKEVWVRISCYLRYKPQDEQQWFDKIISRDFSKDDGWMDFQFESECVGIEVEDLIFEELLEELLVSN